MKNLPSLLLFCFVLTILSCATGNKFGKELNKAAIPADLTQKDYTLLVIKEEGGLFAGKFNRSMAKNLKKSYPGDFELVLEKDLESDKYANTDKYRYVLRNNASSSITMTSTTYSGPGPGTTSHRTYTDQIITDRKENKAYPSTQVMAPGFATGVKMFAAYMAAR